ncbi:MAG: putative membrane protein YecN with MAPEG domain [Myxococcota bacterium]|jgi:uncharacterized membrane protein YecN with MAPEG domain
MPADVMQIYTVCATFLSLLILGMAFHTGTIRGFIEKRYHNTEDVIMGSGSEEGIDGPKTLRWIAAHRNAMENFLPFIPLGFLLASDVPQSAVWGGVIIAYTFFRFTHFVAYVNAKQPFRTLSFAAAWLCMCAMGVRVLYGVFA